MESTKINHPRGNLPQWDDDTSGNVKQEIDWLAISEDVNALRNQTISMEFVDRVMWDTAKNITVNLAVSPRNQFSTFVRSMRGQTDCDSSH